MGRSDFCWKDKVNLGVNPEPARRGFGVRTWMEMGQKY